MAIFDNSIGYILKNEGGFCDVKGDLGGATNMGITQETLSRWMGKPASIDEIKNLENGMACQVYKSFYWDPLDLTQVDYQHVATCIFDCAVNRGLHVAVVYAQYACNGYGKLLTIDGVIGPKTIDAINSLTVSDFITSFHEEVVEGYREIVKRLPVQSKFLKGWLSRADKMLSLVPGMGEMH